MWRVSGDILGGLGKGGTYAVGVALADDAVDGVAVELRGFHTGAGFEVVGEAGGGYVVVFAEGAGDGLAAVDAGVPVLCCLLVSW